MHENNSNNWDTGKAIENCLLVKLRIIRQSQIINKNILTFFDLYFFTLKSLISRLRSTYCSVYRLLIDSSTVHLLSSRLPSTYCRVYRLLIVASTVYLLSRLPSTYCRFYRRLIVVSMWNWCLSTKYVDKIYWICEGLELLPGRRLFYYSLGNPVPVWTHQHPDNYRIQANASAPR